jgi:hypothetical protein
MIIFIILLVNESVGFPDGYGVGALFFNIISPVILERSIKI